MAENKIINNPISMPVGLPPTQTAFNAHWAINPAVASITLSQALMNTSVIGAMQDWFISKTEWISSLMVYPFDIPLFYGLPNTASFQQYVKNIKIADKELKDSSNNPLQGFSVTGLDSMYLHKICSFSVNPADLLTNLRYLYAFYHSRISLYLPYASSEVTLESEQLYDATYKKVRKITVYLSVDFDTGAGTYYIVSANPESEATDSYLCATVNAQVGFPIALGGSNANEMVKEAVNAFANTALGAVAGATAGGVPGMIAGSVKGATSFLNVNQHYRSIGGSSNKTSFNCPKKVMLSISMPNIADVSETYLAQYGLPLQESRKLSMLKGFTRVSDVHVENIQNATLTELNAIENMLKSGVIL